MRARPFLPVLALAAAATLVAPPASAAPPQPACGDTLAVDTRLRADLTCTAGTGLRLAPGVTLDLRGHSLRGSGDGVGLEVASAGSVVVRNGTVTGWATGLRTYAVEDGETGPLTVDRMRFDGNGDGVDVSAEAHFGGYAKPTTVTRSTLVRSTGAAVVAGWGTPVTLDRTIVADNAAGVRGDSGDAVVTGSRFLRNQTAIVLYEGYVDVRESSFVENATGVVSTGSHGSISIVGSRFSGGGTAVDGRTAFVGVADSRFTGTGTGVVVSSHGGTVEGSTFRANGAGIVGQGYGRIVGNVLRDNGDGIDVEAEPFAGDLEVGGNDVRRSTGWGIHVPGATDLGGNVARGNGNEPQCVGVVCDGRPRS